MTFVPTLTRKEVASVLLPERGLLALAGNLAMFAISVGVITVLALSFPHRVLLMPFYLLPFGILAFRGARLSAKCLRAHASIRRTFETLVKESADRGPLTLSDEGLHYGAGRFRRHIHWWAIKQHSASGDAILIETEAGVRIVLSTAQLLELKAYFALSQLLDRRACRRVDDGFDWNSGVEDYGN